MGNKKDINLLPEELRYSSSRFAGKRKNDNAVKEVSDSVKGLMDIITSKVSSIQYEKAKEWFPTYQRVLKVT